MAFSPHTAWHSDDHSRVYVQSRVGPNRRASWEDRQIYRPNALKHRIHSGQKSFGVWLGLYNAMAAEALAQVGYDYVIIDNEHGAGSLTDTVHQLQAVATTPTTAVVRVPWNDHVYLKRVLDIGAEAVMIPNIQTVEEARAAVAACRYPPRGFRGSAYTIARGADYGGAGFDYIAQAHERLAIILQIETKTAVGNIAEIAAVDGVDLLFIGPNDLSGSIGKLAQWNDPEVKALIAQAETAIKATGKPMGVVPHGDRDAAALFDAGYAMVAASTDLSLMRAGAVNEVTAYRKRFG
jgi:4-hydroxy-2-oxoheptanedioate aldolase